MKTKKLCLYTIFHLNLAYSSIPEKDYPLVIKRCYAPLFDICEEMDIPLGIEASGYTLEKIKEISPALILKWKKLLKNKKCELIGSGYAQIIGPLVPAEVNFYNLKIGHQVYQSILGIKPRVALVNEQAYSQGLIEHYLKAGYKAIMMEWNNPRQYHPEWNDLWRYYKQNAMGADNRCVPLIWVDTIAFQKFQRYVHGESGLDEYIDYLKTHLGKSDRFFPLYGNDAEIFDYRPGRYGSEAGICQEGEWNRINLLFEYFAKNKEFKFLLPSQIIKLPKCEFSDKKLRLESPQQPISVKKQEKYNLYRWALTGRDDLGINTKCYRIYKSLLESKNENLEDWKELCYLWSSDFRTHITEDRWTKYLKRLDRFLESNLKADTSLAKKSQRTIKTPCSNKLFQCFEDRRYLTIETDSIKCVFDKLKGLSINSFWFKNKSKKPLFGTLPLDYYDDISFGADFYTGHMIIEKPGEHKITDLIICVPELLFDGEFSLTVRTEISARGAFLKKEYHINLKKPCFEIEKEISMPARELGVIHIGNITFIPASFDRTSLFFATHNGGKEMEKFKIKDDIINHAQGLSSLISAKHGLGATEGIVVVGDKEKKITIEHGQTISALIPSIRYEPMAHGLYFLRLQYSAKEMDETFRESRKEQKLRFYWKIT